MRRIVAIGAALALLLGLLAIAGLQRMIVVAGWGGRDGTELGVPKDVGPPKPVDATRAFMFTKDVAKGTTATPAEPVKK